MRNIKTDLEKRIKELERRVKELEAQPRETHFHYYPPVYQRPYFSPVWPALPTWPSPLYPSNPTYTIGDPVNPPSYLVTCELGHLGGGGQIQ